MHLGLSQRLSSLKVGQKIGLGYTLALGIAVSGTIVGFGISHHHQQHTKNLEVQARNKVELLHRLQSRVLQTRTHQQQLIPLAEFPDRFQDEYSHLLKHKDEIKGIWAELTAFLDTTSPTQNTPHHQAVRAFSEAYSTIPQRYSQAVEQRVEQINQLDLTTPEDIAQAQALMLAFTNSDLALEFDGISDDLVGLIEQSYQALETAVQLHEQAGQSAEKIVITSILLSVAIAILIAMVTSRTIARPIQDLTTIARRSTEESNFDLQASVEQKNEIGTLATAFNQLIRSVKQLLEEQKVTQRQLEDYSQTLEFRVEERTDALNKKTVELEKLLEELQRTQVQMIQGEKMSALGQMVAGVAHEINNPVNFIHGNLKHLQDYTSNLSEFITLYQTAYSDPPNEIQDQAEEIDIEFIKSDLPKMIASMKMGTERIRNIVLSLRNFSRMDEADFKAVDIHDGIDSTLLILQHRLKAKSNQPAIQVVRDYDDLPLVECYPGQLNQVFMNILSNAIDALEEDTTPRSLTSLEQPQGDSPATPITTPTATPKQITIRTTSLGNHHISIEITDNGIGMSETVNQQIFNPFFTTKTVGKGTGMGLPISYQIVTEKHNGKLESFSTPGQGTAFIIQIPIQQPNPKTT